MRKSFLLIGFYAMLSTILHARETQRDTSLLRIWRAGLPFITHCTTEDYKASIQNWGFLQDDDGIMYVANSSGVLEFDGVSWRLITLPYSNKVSDLVKGEDGTIYVAAVRELGYLAPDSLGNLQFQSLLPWLDSAYHNFTNPWNAFALNDAIYFIYPEYIFKWDGKKFKVWEPPRFFIGGHLVNDQIFIEALDKGVMRLENDSLQLVIKENREVRVGISFMLPYDDDQLWMVYRRHGELLFDHQQAVPFDITGKDVLRGKHPYKAVQLENGDYVIATLGHGVYQIDPTGKIKYVFTKESGLNSNLINNVFVDREGTLWVATNKGINRIEISSPLRLFDHLHGLSENIEKVIYHQHQLYAGTHNGLYYLPESTLTPDFEKPFFQRVDGIEGFVWSFASAGKSLMLANSANLFRVDEENKAQLIKYGGDGFVQLLRPEKDPTQVYVGSFRGNVYSINTNDNQWKLDDPFLKVEGNICQMVENPDGSLWVGTRYSGIYNVQLGEKKSNDSAVHKILRFDTTQGLPEIKEVPICRAGNRTYFSTDNGMFFFDSLDQKFVKDTLLMSQLSGHITEMGMLTATGNDGLWFSAASDYKSYVYKYEEGTVEELIPYRRFYDFDIYNIYDTHEGIVFFCGSKGIVAYNEQRNQDFNVAYSTQIRNVVTADGNLIFGGHARKNTPPLPYTKNALRITYALSSYDKPEASQYQYLLEGFDERWSAWMHETQRDFTNLPEGEYRFRVRGQNVYGQMAEEAVYAFTILPPWYRTWWAYTVYALAFAGFVSWVVQWRSARLRREKEALENIVRERTLQLEEQAEQLKEMDQMKSHLFANISHEFRTPLTLIKGPVDELVKKGEEKIRLSDAQMIDRNADRLLRLVNQLLDLSKLDAGNLDLEPETGDIFQFLRALAAAFSSHAEQRGMKYRIGIPQDTLYASFDHDKVEKIVYNLLSNAFKFTPDEGEVTIKVSYREMLLELRVIDSGQGIAPEQLSHIFDRFFQTDSSTTREQEGTGIGLALTQELVVLMNGEITVQSESGKGTTFTVNLPLPLAESVEPEVSKEEISKTATSHNPIIAEEDDPIMNGKQEEAALVLVVEDNADMRTFIKVQLLEDFKILEAANGKAGLDIAQQEVPDLIITDLMMPQLDGMELCHQLKTDERTSHIPVIMLTAKAGQEHKIEGLETGADDYLTKPFDRQELQVRVKNLIAQRQALRKRFSREVTLEPRQIAISSLDEQFLQKVIELLENNLADTTFGMAEMQDALAMSKTQLYRKIKALTDQSPGEFIRNYRLKRAAQILSQHGENVTQVAYSVGFNNLSYFAKCFKEMYNVAPSEYKSSAHS